MGFEPGVEALVIHLSLIKLPPGTVYWLSAPIPLHSKLQLIQTTAVVAMNQIY